MSILQGITHTTQTKTGVRIVIAGVEKVGKTTLACSAPRPLLIPLETGYAGVSINRTAMLTTFTDVISLLQEISNAKDFPFQSLIFDSSTALERLIHNATLASDPTYTQGNKKALTMEAALGGYGKAYQYANELFNNFLGWCDHLAVNKGINIILTCHVFPSKVMDPTAGEYDSWDLLMHSPKNQKAYGKREMLTQWADMVGFFYEPIFVNQGDTLNQGISKNQGRVLGLSRTPGYVAGNRFGVQGEIAIPKEKSWNYLAQAIHKTSGIDVYNRD